MNNNSGSNSFTEKEVLHDALEAQKHVTGMFNNYSNECANPQVRKVMLDILNDEHSIQFDVFNDMQTRGYYSVTPAQQDKVNQIKSTYAQQASSGSSGGSGGMIPGIHGTTWIQLRSLRPAAARTKSPDVSAECLSHQTARHAGQFLF